MSGDCCYPRLSPSQPRIAWYQCDLILPRCTVSPLNLSATEPWRFLFSNSHFEVLAGIRRHRNRQTLAPAVEPRGPARNPEGARPRRQVLTQGMPGREGLPHQGVLVRHPPSTVWNRNARSGSGSHTAARCWLPGPSVDSRCSPGVWRLGGLAPRPLIGQNRGRWGQPDGQGTQRGSFERVPGLLPLPRPGPEASAWWRACPRGSPATLAILDPPPRSGGGQSNRVASRAGGRQLGTLKTKHANCWFLFDMPLRFWYGR